jgi:hypothetical protein
MAAVACSIAAASVQMSQRALRQGKQHGMKYE